MSSRWGFLESYGFRQASGWTLHEHHNTLPAVMPLPSLASWTLRGQGAMEFLQGYVTSDLASITKQAWRPTCFCSIKGRVLATAFVSGEASEVRFLMREEVIGPLFDSLKKYLAFARTCSIAREPMNAFGCIGELSEELGIQSLQLPSEAPLGLLTAPQDQANRVWQTLAAIGHTADERLWTRHEIDAGFVHISLATSEEFLPQMLGLDHLGAVSYTKGCYLGQEIVARAEHRGKVKRSLAHVEIGAADIQSIKTGCKLQDPTGRDVGVLVASAPGAERQDTYTGLAVVRGKPSARLQLADSKLEVRLVSHGST